MIVETATIQRTFLVRVNPGNDILKSIQLAVLKKKIKNAFIMNGLGASASYHNHVVSDTTLPPAEIPPNGDLLQDIVSITGMIIDGRTQAHIHFTDDKKSHNGHLKEDIIASTFCVICLVEFSDVDINEWDSFRQLC